MSRWVLFFIFFDFIDYTQTLLNLLICEWGFFNCTFSFFFIANFFFFFQYIYFYLFIYFWLCWVFVSVRGLSPVVASGGHSSSRCTGLSLSRPLLLRSTGSRRAGSAIVAHGPSCSAACGIFPDQGSNPRPLHWQADSQPLRHQGSPVLFLLIVLFDGYCFHIGSVCVYLHVLQLFTYRAKQ